MITRMMPAAPVQRPGPNPVSAPQDPGIKAAATAFESSFIAEMLKEAGAGKSRQTFGGGAGEQAFSSFLLSAEAEKIAQAGGFGLTERIMQSMKATKDHG